MLPPNPAGGWPRKPLIIKHALADRRYHDGCSVIGARTTTPSEVCAPVHDRMPVRYWWRFFSPLGTRLGFDGPDVRWSMVDLSLMCWRTWGILDYWPLNHRTVSADPM